MRSGLAATIAILGILAASGQAAERLPIFDAHLHYSHDAWDSVPPAKAIEILRAAGLKRAMISSSDDAGTQRLFELAPDLVIPVLRPYRKRADISTWVRDDSVPGYLAERLAKYRYAAIGEFHVFGADADLPVVRATVALAKTNGLFLHLHGDEEAVERVFRQDPDARILWAHSGFAPAASVGAMLQRHRQLWADLAYRSDHARDAKLEPAWRDLFAAYPDRFVVGTDTFTPERWHYIGSHADFACGWLADLPPAIAARIAYGNGDALFGDAFSAHAPRRN